MKSSFAKDDHHPTKAGVQEQPLRPVAPWISAFERVKEIVSANES
jgi:hypothetical protein